MDELLDILDEHGNLSGESRPRSVVHTQGLWHRTVHIYFYRKVGADMEVLVHLRSKSKDLTPNTWDTRFGGHLKTGDTIQQALESELHEEVGITIDPDKLTVGPVQKREYFPNNAFTNIFFYKFEKDINSLLFNDGEVQAAKWMNVNDIIQAATTNPQQWSISPTEFIEIKNLLEKLDANSQNK